MKANELRVGNYFTDGSNILIVRSIIDYPSGTLINNHPVPNDYYNVIPLTEEWLLKFGFTSNGWLYEKTATNGVKYLWYYNTFGYFREDLNSRKANPIAYLANTEYVHQLQNLYFCLTGEELEIKKG